MEEIDFIEIFNGFVSLKFEDGREYDVEKVKSESRKYIERAKSEGIKLDDRYLFNCVSDFLKKKTTFSK